MRIHKFKALCVGVSVIALAGCETMEQVSSTMGNKEKVGTAAGGIFGTILGDQADCDNRFLCQAAGAAIVAFIGNKIGQHLDEQDQLRMAEASQKAATTGEAQSWSNPANGISGKAVVVNTTQKPEPVIVPVLKAKVVKVPPLEMLGTIYKAKSTANLRGGPGTDYVKVGRLSSGESFGAVGKVKGSDWYLISQNGVGSGFVYGSLIEPAPRIKPVAQDNHISDIDISEVQVASTKTCRVIEQSVTLANGTTHSEHIEACEGPNGWERKTA